MREYKDIINYFENSIELAYRDGSLELNKSVVKVTALRKFSNGRWIIKSCQGCDVHELTLNEYLIEDSASNVELADTELYVGSVNLGSLDRDPRELLEIAANICNELRGVNVVRCEFIINVRDYNKVIERDVGVASESKVIIEFIVGVVSRAMKYGYGGTHTALVTNLSSVSAGFIDKLLRRAYEKSLANSRSKPLNPVYAGRHQLILKPEVTAALMHEVSHLLEATAVNRIPLWSKVGPPELDVLDDPHEVTSPSIRLFDDEGVPTIRRKLIEGGVVVDYHHTRLTASQFNSEAGSSYGLYHPPIPFHTTLVVRAGDWRDEEVVSETKRGFIVDGVVKAETEGNYVRVVPEYAMYVEDGEVKNYVELRDVRIPISKLRSLSAIGRSRELRVSYEKGYLVAELAPTVRLEGYVS